MAETDGPKEATPQGGSTASAEKALREKIIGDYQKLARTVSDRTP
jgi:hypothetical protein